MSEQFEDSLNTAYDDAFRTMIQKCDDLVLPMLNYMFGEHYTEEDQIIRSANEEYTQRDGGSITKKNYGFADPDPFKGEKEEISC